MGYNVEDVANLLLVSAESIGEGELMTNMKLQKMLYYQQGFHMALFNTVLFDEDIEAWMYGPVVKSVYEKYKSYGKNGIPGDKNNIMAFNDKREAALFAEVNKVYGKFSAIGLKDMTHQETPWQSVPTGEGSVIPKEIIKEFFKTRLKK